MDMRINYSVECERALHIKIPSVPAMCGDRNGQDMDLTVYNILRAISFEIARLQRRL